MSQVLQDAQQHVTTFSQVLQDIAATDLNGELDEAGVNALKDLLKSFPDVRKKLGAAKKKLEEAKPRLRKKRKSDESNGGKDKRQKDEVVEAVKFGDNVFIEEMIHLVHDQKLDVYAFFKKMMGPNPGTRKEELTCGLSLVLQGVIESDPEIIAKELEPYIRILTVGRAGMPSSKISELGHDALARIYVATEVGEGGTLEQRSGQQLFQHLHQVMGALRFLLAWSALGENENGRRERQVLLSTIFRKRKEMEPDAAVNKQSVEWVAFRTKSKDYRRGAARLWNAYRTLGSLVLLCPQMAFRFFYDSRLGKELSVVIQTIAASLPEDLVNAREETHREALLAVLAKFESTKGVLGGMLKDIEAFTATTGVMDVDAME